mgnify:CR=1 FL=1
MKKKIFIICMLLFLGACGYSSIYSNNNPTNVLISKIIVKGDKKINRQLLTLLSIKEVSVSKESYVLNVSTIKKKRVAAKDKLGNATIFDLSLETTISMSRGNNINTKKFASNFSYNNQKNKFELSRQEAITLENLMENMAPKIILFIYSNK